MPATLDLEKLADQYAPQRASTPAPAAPPPTAEPAPANPYLPIANRAADEAGVPRDLFAAMIEHESHWNPKAVSPKGAQGLGQLMPPTAKSLGVANPHDPEQNLRGSARYLRQHLDEFGGDESKALAAYNAGPAAVRKHGGVPPFPETQDYVQRVMSRRRGYGGVEPVQITERPPARPDLEKLADQYAPKHTPHPQPAAIAQPDLEKLADRYAPQVRRVTIKLPENISKSGKVDLDNLNPRAGVALQRAMDDAGKLGIPITITSGVRSREQQTQLHEDYMAGRLKYPAAPPGHSLHEKGLAVDIHTSDENRPFLVANMEKHGWKWMGDKDPVHFSFTGAPLPAHPTQAETAPAAPAGTGKSAPTTAPIVPSGFPSRGRVSAPLTGEHLGPAPRMTPDTPPPGPTIGAAPTQTATMLGGLRAIPQHGLAGLQQAASTAIGGIGREVRRPGNALTAFFNTIESKAKERRQAAGTGLFDSNVSSSLNDLSAAAHAAKQAAQSGREVPVTFVSDWLDTRKGADGKTFSQRHPKWFAMVHAAEQLLPTLYDPLNRILPAISEVGSAVAARSFEPIAAAAAKVAPPLARFVGPTAEKGQWLNENVVQTSLRHSQDLKSHIQEGVVGLKDLRRAYPIVDKAVTATKQNPLYGLAAHYAAADTGRYPGRVTLSAADAQAIQAAAKGWNIDPNKIADMGNRMARNARAVEAKMVANGQPPMTGAARQQWMKDFFTKLDKEGNPAGLSISADAARDEITRKLVPHAVSKPGPGLAKVPEGWGLLSENYLPAATVARLKQMGAPTTQWDRFVRGTKNVALMQPFTPAKILMAHSTGAGIALNKVGGGIGDYANPVNWVPVLKELNTYWRTGKLSPTMREFSDHNPYFIKGLKDAKIADGTAGKFISVGGKRILLNPAKMETVDLPMGITAKSPSLLTPWSNDHVFLKAHTAVDQFSRLTLYKALRARNVSADQATKMVMQHVISYGARPAELAWLDRKGVWMFNNVPVRMAQLALDTAVKRPDLLARPGQLQDRLLQAFGQQGSYEKVPKDKRSPFLVPNPLKPGQFIDYSAVTPLGEPFHAARGTTRLPGAVEGVRQLAAKTVAGPIAEVLSNRSLNAPSTSKKETILTGLSPAEQWRQLGQHFWDRENPILKYFDQIDAIGSGAKPNYGPMTQGELLASKVGLPSVRGETQQEYRARTKPGSRQRGQTTRDTGIAMMEQVRKSPQSNPRLGEFDEIDNPGQLLAKLHEIKDNIFAIARDPSNFRNGKMTDEAQRKLLDLEQGRQAVMARGHALRSRR